MKEDWTRRPFSIMGHVFDYWELPRDVGEQASFKRELAFDAWRWRGSAKTIVLEGV